MSAVGPIAEIKNRGINTANSHKRTLIEQTGLLDEAIEAAVACDGALVVDVMSDAHLR